MRYAHDGKEYTLSDFYIADEDFFKIFTHEFIAGDPNTALTAPNSLVITEDAALQIFGDTHVVGEALSPPAPQRAEQEDQRRMEFQVTGVVKIFPKIPISASMCFFHQVPYAITIPTMIPEFLEEPYYFSALFLPLAQRRAQTRLR